MSRSEFEQEEQVARPHGIGVSLVATTLSGVWDPYSWVFMSVLDNPDIVAIWQHASRIFKPVKKQEFTKLTLIK